MKPTYPKIDTILGPETNAICQELDFVAATRICFKSLFGWFQAVCLHHHYCPLWGSRMDIEQASLQLSQDVGLLTWAPAGWICVRDL